MQLSISDVPFNQFLGITESENSSYLMQLVPEPHHHNHVDSIHAAALFALAEATSGAYLLKRGSARPDIVGLLRRSTSKYSNPANGTIFGSAHVTDEAFEKAISSIDSKGKALLDVAVQLEDANGSKVATFSFVWLLAASPK